jgi:ferritin-like metal-binding protein YciE
MDLNSLHHLYTTGLRDLCDESIFAGKRKRLRRFIGQSAHSTNESAMPTAADTGIAAAEGGSHPQAASLRTTCTHARRPAYHDCGRLLKQTLEEEGQTNSKLTRLAETYLIGEAKSAKQGSVPAKKEK